MIVEHTSPPIDGSRVRYLTSGSGSPIVLISGAFGTAENFIPLMKILPKRYQCIAIDLPGYGKSTPFPDQPHTIKNYGLFLDKFVTALKLQDPVFLGVSLGASLLLEYATISQNPPKKIFLQSPVYKPFHISGYIRPYLFLFYHVPPIVKLVLEISQFWIIKWLIFYVFGTKELRTPSFRSVVDYGLKNVYQSRPSALVQSVKDVLTLNMEGFLHKVPSDTLLIYGTNEDMFPRSYQERLASLIPKCKFETVTGGTHFLILQMPDRLAQVMLDFLEVLTD